MTHHSTSEILGRVGAPTLTDLSKAISPDRFAAACREIVQTQSGDAAHRALDKLVTELLCSLGYSEGMAIFMAAAMPAHEGGAA